MIKEFIQSWKLSKAYRREQIRIIFLSVLSIACGAAIPFMIRHVIYNIQNGIISLKTVVFFVVIFSVSLLQQFFYGLFTYLFPRLSKIIGADKRGEILARIFTASIYRKKTLDDSVIINRLLNEVYCYGDLLGDFLLTVITNTLRIIVAVVVLVNINIYLFLLSFLTIPVIIILINIVKKVTEKSFYEYRIQYEAFQKLLKEILTAYSDIKQMKAEKHVLARFYEQNKLFLKSENYCNKIRGLIQGSYNTLFSMLPLWSLFGGIALTFVNKCDIGSAIGFYMYITAFIVPLTNFTDARLNVIQNKKKESMVEEIVDSFNFEEAGKNSGSFEFAAIKVNGATFTYNNTTTVKFSKAFNFCTPALYYISADSGTGKSTILKLMTKILSSSESDILFDTTAVNDIPEHAFFDKVTYLSGTPAFIEGTIEDNITYFGRYSIDEKYIELLFNDDEHIDKKRVLNIGEGESLSSGQLQRINILRVFAKGGAQRLIVLDEAVSGVEEEREKEIIHLLKTTFPQAIIIVVSHRKATQTLCDYSIRLET